MFTLPTTKNENIIKLKPNYQKLLFLSLVSSMVTKNKNINRLYCLRITSLEWAHKRKISLNIKLESNLEKNLNIFIAFEC